MLCFHPAKRLSIDEVVKHPFLKQFYHASDEEMVPRKPILLNIDDSIKLSVKAYR